MHKDGGTNEGVSHSLVGNPKYQRQAMNAKHTMSPVPADVVGVQAGWAGRNRVAEAGRSQKSKKRRRGRCSILAGRVPEAAQEGATAEGSAQPAAATKANDAPAPADDEGGEMDDVVAVVPPAPESARAAAAARRAAAFHQKLAAVRAAIEKSMNSPVRAGTM